MRTHWQTELDAPALRVPYEGWATRLTRLRGPCGVKRRQQMTGDRVFVDFGDDGFLVGSGLPTGCGRESFGTLRISCPRHTDWFVFFVLLRVFFVLGVFFFTLVFLVCFLFFEFFFAPGVVAHAVVGDGAGID